MSKRRLFRWPARRTAGLGCLALLVTSIASWYLYGTRPYEPQPGIYTSLAAHVVRVLHHRDIMLTPTVSQQSTRKPLITITTS